MDKVWEDFFLKKGLGGGGGQTWDKFMGGVLHEGTNDQIRSFRPLA